jgi:hypothetical protein
LFACDNVAHPNDSPPFVVLITTQLEASGFDVSGWKTSKKSGGSSGRISRSLDIPADERVIVGGAVDGKQAASSGNSMTFILLVAAAAVCLFSIQSVLTKPIGVGVVIPPGTMKSKCGVMGWVPAIVKDVTKTLLEPFQSDIQTADNLLNCENEYLEVTDQGEIKITDAEGNLLVFLKGSPCTATKKNSCVKGLVMQDNKKVKIGTNVVKSGVSYYFDSKGAATAANRKLSPWPFAEEPKVKLSPSKRG